MWSPESPLYAIGGWEQSKGAVWPMLRDTPRYRLFDVLGHTAVNVGKQLLVFRTGWNAVAYDEQVAVVRGIKTYFPEAYDDFQRSLQQQARLQTIAWAINWVHYGGRAIWLVPLVALEILRFERASAPARRPGSPPPPR